MYITLKRLYNEGRLPDTGLANAVAKGWLSQSQADEIASSKL